MHEAEFAITSNFYDQNGAPQQVTFRAASADEWKRVMKARHEFAEEAKKKGWVSAAPKPTTESASSNVVPTCPVHKTPMKASRKPDTYFCPKRNGDEYCDQKTKGAQ